MMGNKRPLGRTGRVRGWRLGITLCAAALIMGVAGASSASAATTTICVGNTVPDNAACTVGNTVSTLAEALSGASAVDPNNIYIGGGATYDTAAGLDFGSKRVKIVGVGTRPTIRMTAPVPTAAVVATTNSQSSIDNVDIELPSLAVNMTGIFTANGGQKISNVSITGAGGITASGNKGIVMSDATPRVETASIDLGGANSIGVQIGDSVVSSSSTSAIIDDVDVAHATIAVSLHDAYNFKIRRLVSHSKSGVMLEGSSGTISSSLILPSAVSAENSGGYGVSAYSNADQDRSVLIDNCTIVGDSNVVSTGVFSSADDIGTDMSVTVNSSIVAGRNTAFSGSPGDDSTAPINVKYSKFNGVSSGSVSFVGDNSEFFNFGFVDAGNGNYHLALDSSLVDAGDPAALDSTDSATDADGQPRVVSRGAGNIRDIGAFEVQNAAPVPRIAIVTSVPSTTVPTEFSAAGSTDAEGDAMTYDWTFDGAPATSGATIKKLFTSEGPHSVQLTVTDKTGASAMTSTQFIVARGYLPVKLRSQNARLTTKGTFTITLSCPAEAISNCTGRLLFQTAKKVNAKNYPNRPAWIAKTDYLQAARYVFSVSPGTTKKLSVRTYSTFQNILAVKKKFQLVGSLVSGTTSNANLTANRATFTISAPKSKKK